MNTSQQIEVTHSGITVTYNEREDKWQFTLRGRDRSADSLAKAKEYIDKPAPVDKPKTFQNIPAWIIRYSDTPKKIEITGIAEGRGYGGDAKVWINYNGQRSKESVGYAIYPQNQKNNKIMSDIITKEALMSGLREEINDLKSALDKLVLPKED